MNKIQNNSNKSFWDNLWVGFKKGMIPLGNLILKVIDTIYDTLETTNKFYLILSKLHWPPPHSFFSIDNSFVIAEIVKTYEENGLDSVKLHIDKIMVEWHTPEIIGELLDGWREKPWLKQRINILSDVCYAHNNGYYSLSIPALLPHIEGVIADNFKVDTHLQQKRILEHVNTLLHPATIIHNRNHSIRQFISDTLLVKFVHGMKTSSPLSRHAIFHGADIDYGTIQNSLRAILLFDAVNRLFTLEAVKGSNTFHFHGCPTIVASENEHIFFTSIKQAIESGMVFCKICSKVRGIEFLI